MVFIVKVLLPIQKNENRNLINSVAVNGNYDSNIETSELKEENHISKNLKSDKNIEDLSMEVAVKRILVEMKVSNDIWCITQDNKSYLVEFYVLSSDQLDSILDKLAYNKVGKDMNSLIIVTEATASVVPSNKIKRTMSDIPVNKNVVTTFQKFLNTLKSRLTVAQVYHSISQRGDFTVDYLAFIICAAVLADVALVTNRPAVIVASMLLSPMMDPILCVLFGFRLREKNLIYKGIKNTFTSIAICFLVGLLLGIVTHSIANFELVSPYPTKEVSSRGNLNYLPNTAIVTVFSGVSTAFAILNNVVSAMIGNAISLSILPPAVNSGHLVFLALLATVDRYKNVSEVVSGNASSVDMQCQYEWIRDYDMIYIKHSCDFPREFAINAGISLMVTIMNITCILLIGYLVCILKDFAPNSLTNRETQKFYTEDLKEVQESTKTLGYQDIDTQNLAQDAFENYKRCLGITSNAIRDESILVEDFSAVLAAVEEDSHYQTIREKLPEKLDLGMQLRKITQSEGFNCRAVPPLKRQYSMLPHFRLKYQFQNGVVDPEFEHAVSLMRRPHTVSMSSYERKRMVQGVTRKISQENNLKEESAARRKSDRYKRKWKAGKFEVTASPSV